LIAGAAAVTGRAVTARVIVTSAIRLRTSL